MTKSESSARERPPERRRKRRLWRQFFLQFSLRTLLGVTTLSAVGCWWFLQPQVHEEYLAGKQLSLRRQVAAAPRQRGASSPPAQTVNNGYWRLFDQAGGVLAVGLYRGDQPQGAWKAYHANGQVAVEGQMQNGQRVGLWRTFDERGQRESEVTYAVAEIARGQTIDVLRQPFGSVPPSNVYFARRKTYRVRKTYPETLSQRQGPARDWHSGGPLRSEGSFAQDLRKGLWTFYDEQGRVIESGNYRRGLREGWWSVFNSDAGQLEKIEFVAGLRRAEYERRIAEIQHGLASDDSEQQILAMKRLDELGSAGAAQLIAALDFASDNVKLMALRRLQALCTFAIENGASNDEFPSEEALQKIAPLLDASDERVRRSAMLWLYCQSPAERTKLYSGLIGSVQKSHDESWQQEALATIYVADAERQGDCFAELALFADRVQGRPPWLPTVFHVVALHSDRLEQILVDAMTSSDARVRRFAMEVVHQNALRGPFVTEAMPSGGQQLRYEILPVFREVVERAKVDADPEVRAAAEKAGTGPDLRWPGGFF